MKKEKWAVIEENDGIHVRPVKNGQIIETPIVKRINYKNKKTKHEVQSK